MAISSLPSIVIGLTLIYFPESPKFLIEVGEPEAALNILKEIFVSNTGCPGEEYPVRKFIF